MDCTRVVLNREDDHEPCSVGRDERCGELAEEEVVNAPAGGFNTDAPHSAHVT